MKIVIHLCQRKFRTYASNDFLTRYGGYHLNASLRWKLLQNIRRVGRDYDLKVVMAGALREIPN